VCDGNVEEFNFDGGQTESKKKGRSAKRERARERPEAEKKGETVNEREG
jgi:hypothetical protein